MTTATQCQNHLLQLSREWGEGKRSLRGWKANRNRMNSFKLVYVYWQISSTKLHFYILLCKGECNCLLSKEKIMPQGEQVPAQATEYNAPSISGVLINSKTSGLEYSPLNQFLRWTLLSYSAELYYLTVNSTSIMIYLKSSKLSKFCYCPAECKGISNFFYVLPYLHDLWYWQNVPALCLGHIESNRELHYSWFSYLKDFLYLQMFLALFFIEFHFKCIHFSFFSITWVILIYKHCRSTIKKQSFDFLRSLFENEMALLMSKTWHRAEKKVEHI